MTFVQKPQKLYKKGRNHQLHIIFKQDALLQHYAQLFIDIY